MPKKTIYLHNKFLRIIFAFLFFVNYAMLCPLIISTLFTGISAADIAATIFWCIGIPLIIIFLYKTAIYINPQNNKIVFWGLWGKHQYDLDKVKYIDVEKAERGIEFFIVYYDGYIENFFYGTLSTTRSAPLRAYIEAECLRIKKQLAEAFGRNEKSENEHLPKTVEEDDFKINFDKK